MAFCLAGLASARERSVLAQEAGADVRQSAGEAAEGDAAQAALNPELAAGGAGDGDEGSPADVTIVVTRLGQAAGSVHVLDEQQLERFEYDDAHAILGQVPGVYIRQEDGMGLRPNIGIRGGNPDRSKKVTLMEDGVLIGPAPYSAPAAYFTPLMTRMTSVRVIKGPAAIAYGPQTVGGAVDFISRPIPAGTAGELDLALGEYGYAKAHGHFGWSTEQLGFLVEGARLGTTGFAELPSGADTGSTRNEWLVKARYFIDPGAQVGNELRLKLTYSDEVSNETYLGLTDGDLRARPYRRYPASALDRMELQRTSAVLTHVFDVPAWSLTVTTHAYRHVLERAWNKLNRLGGAAVASVLRTPDEPLNAAYYGVLTGELDSTSRADTLYIGPNDRTLVTEGIQSTLSVEQDLGWIAHRLAAGVRLHHDEIRRLHSESGFLMTGGQLVPDGEATLTTARNTDATTALALHAIDAIAVGKLTLTPGVRVELMWFDVQDLLAGEAGDSFTYAILPGAGAYYELGENFGALAGVYRGFSPPAPSMSDLEPEISVNYEAGLRYAAGRSRLELIGFYNDYENLTDICTQSSGCVSQALDRQFDAGAATVYGLEALAAHELPLGPIRLPLSLAYTFTRGEFETSFQSLDPIYGTVSEGDELPYLPRHQLAATLGVQTPWLDAAAALNYVAPMREEPGREPVAQAWASDEQLWLDASLSTQRLGPLTLYANLRNALSAENIVSRRPYGARPTPPRWLQVGAKLQF